MKPITSKIKKVSMITSKQTAEIPHDNENVNIKKYGIN